MSFVDHASAENYRVWADYRAKNVLDVMSRFGRRSLEKPAPATHSQGKPSGSIAIASSSAACMEPIFFAMASLMIANSQSRSSGGPVRNVVVHCAHPGGLGNPEIVADFNPLLAVCVGLQEVLDFVWRKFRRLFVVGLGLLEVGLYAESPHQKTAKPKPTLREPAKELARAARLVPPTGPGRSSPTRAGLMARTAVCWQENLGLTRSSPETLDPVCKRRNHFTLVLVWFSGLTVRRRHEMPAKCQADNKTTNSMTAPVNKPERIG
jgi:hypothetical protein